MKKCLIFVFILLVFSFKVFSGTPFNEGKELFQENRVEEALYLFEEALITKPTADVYKYLAESYNILGMHDDETLVLEEAISNSVGTLSYFYFKLGNAYYLIDDYRGALNSYLEVLKIKKEYLNETFLNIANVSVELELYSSAIDNYTKYLELEPSSIQKRKIIKMIFLLKKQHKEQLVQQEEERRVAEEERLAKSLEDQKAEEARFEQIAENANLESEREARARELEEQRLLYADEERSLLEDKKEFEIAEDKVVNPPDADIEARRKVLDLREQELNEREAKLAAAEQALRDAESALASNAQAPDPVDSTVPKTEEEVAAEESARQQTEFARIKAEEEVRQQALMDDILASLEKIGENAKGINASSENAFGELEESDIDE